MNLTEIFKSEVKKRFDSIESALKREGPEDEALMSLHSLKGDLSYAGDLDSLEGLYALTQKIKKCFNTKSSFDVCLKDAQKLRAKVEGLTPLGSLNGLEALRVILETTIKNMRENLEKDVQFAFVSDDLKLEIGQVLFLKQALLPLVMNSCVHGTENGGSVHVEVLKLEEGTMKARVTDSGGDFAVEDAKLFAGEGLGVAIVRGLVESRGGRFYMEDLPDSGLRTCIDIPFEKASL